MRFSELFPTGAAERDWSATSRVLQGWRAEIASATVKAPSFVVSQNAMLHGFETGAMMRGPPQQLAPAACLEELGLAWAELSAAIGDARFLNAAWKLSDMAVRASGRSSGSAALCDLLASRTASVMEWTRAAQIPPAARKGREVRPAPAASRGTTAPRIAVLSGASSSSFTQFAGACERSGVTLAAAAFMRAPASHAPSSWDRPAEAWYPGESGRGKEPAPDGEAAVAVATRMRIAHRMFDHAQWHALADFIRGSGTDLLVLTGMSIVPPEVLELAPLGAINAHNGMLPFYRGLDAVGWSLLQNDPVFCTVHVAEGRCDSGSVLASVEIEGEGNLRKRVKAAQSRLLAEVAQAVIGTGSLPDGDRQLEADACQYYAMHPALRAMLDRRRASP